MNDGPHEAEALLSAHALGALSQVEAMQVDAHLRQCVSCAAAYAEFEQIASGLLHAVPAVQPPARLRTAIVDALEREAPSRPEARARRSLGWATAVALLTLVALNLAQLVHGADLQRQLQAVASQQRASQAALALRSYPSSRVVEVQAADLRGTFVYDPDFPLAVLYIWGLTDPGSDRAYQAWLISPSGERTSGGLLELPADGGFASLVVRAPQPLQDYSGFGVTLEPAGGSPQPTGPRILGADL